MRTNVFISENESKIIQSNAVKIIDGKMTLFECIVIQLSSHKQIEGDDRI